MVQKGKIGNNWKDPCPELYVFDKEILCSAIYKEIASTPAKKYAFLTFLGKIMAGSLQPAFMALHLHNWLQVAVSLKPVSIGRTAAQVRH